MKIRRNGTTPSRNGPAENFTGAVRIDILFRAEPPERPAEIVGIRDEGTMSMRATRIHRHGGSGVPACENVGIRQPGAGEVLDRPRHGRAAPRRPRPGRVNGATASSIANVRR